MQAGTLDQSGKDTHNIFLAFGFPLWPVHEHRSVVVDQHPVAVRCDHDVRSGNVPMKDAAHTLNGPQNNACQRFGRIDDADWLEAVFMERHLHRARLETPRSEGEIRREKVGDDDKVTLAIHVDDVGEPLSILG
ncbi:BQ5605_C002g00995 [Microbotryum silenes-dioicae]|uniref:BQ5605_C002g00995 protein n=1 Tax=Microbotryum silenes-dioicae TaxID=796604 RepID=A0A2X0MJA4_9BASI|nr:BQ5605_C002g00995 [Microbotryum silenes-dioicae]